ncbi:SDR family oxidoreductase [Hyphomonas sp. FCG-A18]|uniref:SDR family oxidoreductase n=1 Tax=Hyphomonas sp. FCG-A18 TaxID=3080019 RepID=UPI002B2DA7A3|nr:SDR family oxidoreductase [Hyphomonas sp. FCG-A18]
MATVLITGANRGIGLELVKAYIARDDIVIATCREPAKADALQATGAEVFQMDVSSDESVQAFAKALDGRAVDLLINNAGVGDRAGLDNVDFETFAYVVNVNTLGPVRVLQALSDNVAAGAGKKIANISSQLGSIANATGDMGLAYRVSKAGLNMALKSATSNLAEKGISLLTLHPGWVATDMGGEQAPVHPEESAAGLVKVIDANGVSGELHFLDWQGTVLPW